VTRNLTIFSAVAVLSLAASGAAFAKAATAPEGHHARHSAAAPGEAGQGIAPQNPAGVEFSPGLSSQERQVSEVAAEKGDREFLMIDKALGKLIVFDDGKPVLSGAALTGASADDHFKPGILRKPDSYKFTTDEKVTPAGRFTVSRTYDNELGTTFEINEVHGKDWWIGIHRVYLGIPSEHRQERLQSGNPEAEHITFGCINVAPETLHYLTAHLPRKGKTPVYILPRDETATLEFFAPHVTASVSSNKTM
jgi:hypothetical protein